MEIIGEPYSPGLIFPSTETGLRSSGKTTVGFVLTSGCYLLFFIGKAIIAKTQHTSMKEILQAQYPYAPFVLFGWIIFLLIGIFGG